MDFVIKLIGTGNRKKFQQDVLSHNVAMIWLFMTAFFWLCFRLNRFGAFSLKCISVRFRSVHFCSVLFGSDLFDGYLFVGCVLLVYQQKLMALEWRFKTLILISMRWWRLYKIKVIMFSLHNTLLHFLDYRLLSSHCLSFVCKWKLWDKF